MGVDGTGSGEVVVVSSFRSVVTGSPNVGRVPKGGGRRVRLLALRGFTSTVMSASSLSAARCCRTSKLTLPSPLISDTDGRVPEGGGRFPRVPVEFSRATMHHSRKFMTKRKGASKARI